MEDADTAGVTVALGSDGLAAELETNSTGRADVMSFVLTSKPFNRITLRLTSKVCGVHILMTVAETIVNGGMLLMTLNDE